MPATSPSRICSSRNVSSPSESSTIRAAKLATGVRSASQTNTHNAVQPFAARVSQGPSDSRGNHHRCMAIVTAAMPSRISAARMERTLSWRSFHQVSNSARAL